jgi:N utilization substance protein B
MTRPRPSSRHRSRRAALQVLYAMDLGTGREALATPTLAQEAFETATEHFELPEAARAFAKQLVTGVAAELKQLDQTLAEHTTHWRVERMGAVDRNVLRLAVYELQHSDTPIEVVIDEAVELARCFGTERSPAFVNGVLDGILRAGGRGSGPSAES